MEKIDYTDKILDLKKKKNAIILAHYYQTSDIQDVADYVGDSLALAQIARNNDSDIILFAGVKFMAETAKILSPDKKVLLPDINAGCSLADSCKAADFKRFIDEHPGRTVISYVNTTAEIKALSDIVCTSSNALKIVESLPEDEKIIFGPDKNLGSYVSGMTKRDMLIWDGACHVHDNFSAGEIVRLKKSFPDAKVLVHPECNEQVRQLADCTGSTKDLLDFSIHDKADTFIVVTEPGVIHQMRKSSPHKKFIAVGSDNCSCRNGECEYMKMVTMEKLFHCLENETPEITVDSSIIDRAVVPVIRMLNMSK